MENKHTRRGFTQNNWAGQAGPALQPYGAGSDNTSAKGHLAAFIPPHPAFGRPPLPQGARRTTRGFTLIELLIVVLIIGILAAVAVPKYNLAIEKSRATEAITIINSLQKAIDLYILENGYPNAIQFFLGDQAGARGRLDIDIESTMDCSQRGGGSVYCIKNHFIYQAYCTGTFCQVDVFRKKNGDWQNDDEYRLRFTKNKADLIWKKNCQPFTVKFPYAEKFCRGLEKQGWGYNTYK